MALHDRLGLIGQTIEGRYTVTQLIGEGGMGAVYSAQHARLGRRVAIKCLHREYSRDTEALARFFDEARAAATLGHANITESLDVGELPDGAPYIVMEYLDGRSLDDEIDRTGKLPIRRALKIGRQIAYALEAAHNAGIIHRDLKSDNVFLTDRDDNPDHVKILDFGVARVLERGTGLTKPGQLVGTPEFMSPEQIADPDSIDHRADIYSAGAVLYHMLAGQKPYGGLPINTLLHRILESPPPPLTGVPDRVRAIVEAAMDRDRDRRIQSMSELRDRLEQAMPLMTGSITPVSLVEETALVRPRPVKRSVIVALAAVAFVGIAVGAWGLVHTLRSSTTPNAEAAARVPDPPAPQTQPPAVVATEPAPSEAPPNEAVASTSPVHAVGKPLLRSPAKPVHHYVAPKPVAKVIEHKPAKVVADPPAAKHVEPEPPATVPPPAPAPAPPPPAPAPTPPPEVAHTPPPAPAEQPATIDVAATRAAVRTHVAAIQECYDRAKMDDASLTGKMTVRITVSPDGAVAKVDVTSSTLGSSSAQRCITGEIARWRLPKPNGSGSASFSYPFVFE